MSKGSGYGSGYGYGEAYGDGSGEGYGAGYGDGYRYGPGSGSGYGYGYGYGDGSGDGYGSGPLEYWASIAKDNLPTAGGASIVAFWKSDSTGSSANGGGLIQGAAPGVIHTPRRPGGRFEPCTDGAVHGTTNPSAWEGSRCWLVELSGHVVAVDKEKFAATERKIIGELKR